MKLKKKIMQNGYLEVDRFNLSAINLGYPKGVRELFFYPVSSSDTSNHPYRRFLGSSFDDYLEFNPRVQISEDSGSYYIELSIKGFKSKHCKIKFKNNRLSIYGKNDRAAEAVLYSLEGLKNMYFEKVFLFSEDVDTESIEAFWIDDLLTITMPKLINEVIGEKEIEISDEFVD